MQKYLNVVFYCSNNTWCWKCYLIKKEFNKQIFSYNWFIENDCHNLQLKRPIRRNRHDLTAIITTCSLIAPWPYIGRLHWSKLYLFISINKNLINFILVLMVFFKSYKFCTVLYVSVTNLRKKSISNENINKFS